jgi:hypothetical protein
MTDNTILALLARARVLGVASQARRRGEAVAFAARYRRLDGAKVSLSRRDTGAPVASR